MFIARAFNASPGCKSDFIGPEWKFCLSRCVFLEARSCGSWDFADREDSVFRQTYWRRRLFSGSIILLVDSLDTVLFRCKLVVLRFLSFLGTNVQFSVIIVLLLTNTNLQCIN